MTEHPQTRIGGVDVDAAMVPLLRALWQRGIRTVSSCQSFSAMNGAAYVGFVTEQDYEAFKEIVLSVSRVVVDVQPSSELREQLSDPVYLEEVAQRFGCWAVGFPPADLRAVTVATLRPA